MGILSLSTRVEALLSAQREAEHLHVEATHPRAKQRELTLLCSNIEWFEGEVEQLRLEGEGARVEADRLREEETRL